MTPAVSVVQHGYGINKKPTRFDTIEYNLEQFDDFSIDVLDLLKEATAALISHM